MQKSTKSQRQSVYSILMSSKDGEGLGPNEIVAESTNLFVAGKPSSHALKSNNSPLSLTATLDVYSHERLRHHFHPARRLLSYLTPNSAVYAPLTPRFACISSASLFLMTARNLPLVLTYAPVSTKACAWPFPSPRLSFTKLSLTVLLWATSSFQPYVTLELSPIASTIIQPITLISLYSRPTDG